jgi:hypothetical protein
MPIIFSYNSHKLDYNLKVRTLLMYQYTVHEANFCLLEVLISYFIPPNVNFPVSPPSIYLIWFRTRIIGNKSNVLIL